MLIIVFYALAIHVNIFISWFQKTVNHLEAMVGGSLRELFERSA